MSGEWDVLVAGAGPAGSVAARELARRGCTVLLADRAVFPRDKVCGCCVNEAALGVLRSVGLESLTTRLGAISLTSVRLAASGRSAQLAIPGGVAVSRKSLDDALIQEAISAGVTFRPATTVRRTRQGWAIQSADAPEQSVQPRVVIVADGLNGRLTAESVIQKHSRIGAGVVVADAPEEYEPGTIYMATGQGGYVGLVRLEDGRLDIAAAWDAGYIRQSAGLGSAAANLLLDAGFPPIPHLERCTWRGTPPLTRSPRRRAGPGWLAIGDAAGYVEPFTGEGMAWAVASGVAVAPLAHQAIHMGWSDRIEQEWERLYTRLIRQRQGPCRVLAHLLRSPFLTRVTVRVLTTAPGLASPVVSRINRPWSFPSEVFA